MPDAKRPKYRRRQLLSPSEVLAYRDGPEPLNASEAYGLKDVERTRNCAEQSPGVGKSTSAANEKAAAVLAVHQTDTASAERTCVRFGS
jgi:hypothetical protein